MVHIDRQIVDTHHVVITRTTEQGLFERNIHVGSAIAAVCTNADKLGLACAFVLKPFSRFDLLF